MTYTNGIRDASPGVNNPAFEYYLARKRAEFGDKFDPSGLAPQFIPYFRGERITVEFVGAAGTVYETKRGTVGVTTGHKPAFLLMLTKRSMGSSYLLGAKDRIVGAK